LAARGLRAIAYDRPGYGRTDDPADASPAYQQQFILRFMDALGIDKAGLVGHSQTGNFVVAIGLEQPEQASRIMVVGTGSLLPPLEGVQTPAPGEGETVEGREPTRDDIRAVLEAQLYNHSLITPELIEARYQMSLGHSRGRAPQGGGSGGARVPLWQRLGELTMPLLMMYGKQDRGNVEPRAELFKQRYPNLDLRLVDHCKHLVQFDAADQFQVTAGEFFTAGA
jgi:pimeloyl-ACP methyl ester carboxylesterase